jgi:hypothetical protein
MGEDGGEEEGAMRIFGKTLGDYLRFAAGVLALVVAMGVARLALSLAGAPVSAVKYVSVTTMALLGVAYLGVRTHTSGFGSYRQLLPLMVITLGAASWVSGFAVVLAMATGSDNIYSIPEYSGGQDGKTFFHAFAHFVIAPFVAGFIAWGLSSLVMLVTKHRIRAGSSLAES